MNSLKALAGVFIAAAAATTAAAPDGFTLVEAITIAAFAVGGFFGVYTVKPGPGITTPKPAVKS